jgi:hypothetical protein
MPLLAQTLRDEATNLFVVFNQKESHGMGGTTAASRSRSPRNDELRRRVLYLPPASLASAHSHEVFRVICSNRAGASEREMICRAWAEFSLTTSCKKTDESCPVAWLIRTPVLYRALDI